jgi:Domain of unknown function (DUF4167)
MTTTAEPKGAAAQPRPNMKMPRKPQIRKTKPSRPPGQHNKPQNAQRNYERYLALARTEAIRGDRVAAENYLQHAEHYLRSMQEDCITARPARPS